MALIKCEECGMPFDGSLPSCPNCGCPNNNMLADNNQQTTSVSESGPAPAQHYQQGYAQTTMRKSVQHYPPKLTAENTLKGIATFVLVLGIILSVVYLIVGIYAATKTRGLFSGSEASMIIQAIIRALMTFLFTLTVWALLRVVANISTTLKEMNSKM